MIPIAEPELGKKELDYVSDCITSGWISSIGSYVTRFEKVFADYTETAHALATSNGTTALHLVLAAFGIGEGDEVIMPDMTFVATANAVTYTDAISVFCDVEKDTWCIDASKIEALVTPRTKAIVPVHLFGHPCDMDVIMAIARKHGLKVIEDAAEAHGALYKGKKVGSIGHAGCFSFYGNKIITTGEGGMVTTNDAGLTKRMAHLRDHAMSPTRRYYHDVVGYNYRITNLQAALGVAQMERIDTFIEKKRRLANLYTAALKGHDGLTLPIEKEGTKHVYWMYSLLVPDPLFLAKKLRSQGIDSRPFFYPLHELPPYRRDESYPISTMLHRKGITLPSSVSLTDEQVAMICKKLLASLGTIR